MNILERLNKSGDRITFYYDFGRGAGQRPSTGIFIYTKPKTQIERNHNKEALALLETKKSQLILEQQSIGSAFIPTHKFKANFLDYYDEYVRNHKLDDNRHLPCSLQKFRKFIEKDFIAPIEITEDLCKRFRKYLMTHLTGETPQNYFARFKWVVAALIEHATTKQVRTTYKRHRPKNQMEAISKLPMPEHLFKRSDTTE